MTAPLPPLWGIQHLPYQPTFGVGDWNDWEPHSQRWHVQPPSVVRFFSQQYAEDVATVLREMTMADYARQMTALREARKRHRARVRVLQSADLWLTDTETETQILPPPRVPGKRQQKKQLAARWRVVLDEDMVYPRVHHKQDCQCDVCFFTDELDVEMPGLHLVPPPDLGEGDREALGVEWVLSGFTVRLDDLVIPEEPWKTLYG